MAKNQDSSLLNPLQIILIIALIAAAGTIGHLWTKIQYTNRGSQENVKAQQAGQPTPDQPRFPSVPDLEPINDRDHILGNPDAKIALIEYSDLQCPYCADFQDTAQQLMDEYGDQIMHVYRHYPIDQLHPNARQLAIGSECAARQGGEDLFWEFIDYVFENKSQDAQEVASALNLDSNQFETCLDNQELADYIQTSIDLASAAGIEASTPSIILLNTQTDQSLYVSGSRPLSQFKDIINNQLLNP